MRRSRDKPLVEIDIGLLADQVGVTTTDTLDLRQGVHDLLLSIDLWAHVSGLNASFHRSMRTLVLRRRKMYWKFDFSPDTSDMMAVL